MASRLTLTAWLVSIFASLAVSRASSDRVQHQQSSHHGASTERQSETAAAWAMEPSLQAGFEYIYYGKGWGSEGGGSGIGSDTAATVYTQNIIQQVIDQYHVTSLLDAPCGAMTWQPGMLEAIAENHPGFRYKGLDIVRSVVAENQRRLAGHTNWSFELADVTQAQLPSGYDLILCRDALQHLPLLFAVAALENFARSSARYLLVGSYRRTTLNKNIAIGGYYDIDIMRAPFNLSAPLMAYNELTNQLLGGDTPEKHLLLYSIEKLREVDWHAMRERAAAQAAAETAQVTAESAGDGPAAQSRFVTYMQCCHSRCRPDRAQDVSSTLPATHHALTPPNSGSRL